MARYRRIAGAFGLTLFMAGTSAPPAAAQTLGIFRWQTRPFCNLLTLVVTATPAGFRMEGTDDQCGGTPASAIGMAYPKVNGTVGVGLTLVFPGAVSLHVDGTINPGAGYNGAWSDSVGRSGTLTFVPGGVATSGPLRPVVAPVVPYGSTIVQPPTGLGNYGLVVSMNNDPDQQGDAAAVYGLYGGDSGFTAPGSAGVRGDSFGAVGVMGTTASGWGVVGGARSYGIGVQGYAEGGESVGVHAVHASGGTALDINNGAIKVSGAVRSAFVWTITTLGSCNQIDHPLLNGDPNALVFVAARSYGAPAVEPDFFNGRWSVCASLLSPGEQISVLVIKQ